MTTGFALGMTNSINGNKNNSQSKTDKTEKNNETKKITREDIGEKVIGVGVTSLAMSVFAITTSGTGPAIRGLGASLAGGLCAEEIGETVVDTSKKVYNGAKNFCKKVANFFK